MDISICITTFKAREFLRDCLRSIHDATPEASFEIIVVDNGSQDGTVEMLSADFPQVRLIQNDENLGFTRPYNQALRVAGARFLVILNPDTIVHPEALERLMGFLETHPRVGVVGPKVLNRDGSLQKPCRRGDARPWNAISYFTRLSRLFPKRKFFSGYLMTYMDEDETHPVDGVSGSCMMIRREVIDEIGYLDERFFAYQEDADYCLRARQAGWEVYYYPEAQVTHFGGQGGSRVQPYRSVVEWHRSYWLYYRKHFASDYFFLFNWLYYFAMLVKFVLAILVNALRREKHAGPKRG
jgi:GT2 family glycosyltransferase